MYAEYLLPIEYQKVFYLRREYIFTEDCIPSEKEEEGIVLEKNQKKFFKILMAFLTKEKNSSGH